MTKLSEEILNLLDQLIEKPVMWAIGDSYVKKFEDLFKKYLQSVVPEKVINIPESEYAGRKEISAYNFGRIRVIFEIQENIQKLFEEKK